MTFSGKFIGKNGSMGFRKGQIYQLKSVVRDSCIVLQDTNSSLSCPYSGLEAVFNNWELMPEKSKEQVAADRAEFDREFEQVFGNKYMGSDFL